MEHGGHGQTRQTRQTRGDKRRTKKSRDFWSLFFSSCKKGNEEGRNNGGGVMERESGVRVGAVSPNPG